MLLRIQGRRVEIIEISSYYLNFRKDIFVSRSIQRYKVLGDEDYRPGQSTYTAGFDASRYGRTENSTTRLWKHLQTVPGYYVSSGSVEMKKHPDTEFRGGQYPRRKRSLPPRGKSVQRMVTSRLEGPVTSILTFMASLGSRGSIFSGHSTRHSAPLSKYSS